MAKRGYRARPDISARTNTGILGVPHHHLADKVRTADIRDSMVTNAKLADSLVALLVYSALFDAHTILAATTDNTPAALTVNAQSVVGRVTAGNIASLTGAQIMTILTGQSGAAFSMNSQRLTSVGAPTTTNDALVAGQPVPKPLTLTGDGLVTIELRTSLDYSRILGNSKPTKITRGLAQGFSLPIYSADDEELYFSLCVPNRYDEASDITVHVHGWLDTANTDKNFQLRLEWEHISVGDIVPVTSNEVNVETDTGIASQFQCFEISFTINYDIDTPDNIIADDMLAMRLYRIAASENEMAGEIVISHIGVVFRRDKLGASA